MEALFTYPLGVLNSKIIYAFEKESSKRTKLFFFYRIFLAALNAWQVRFRSDRYTILVGLQ